MFFRRNAPFGGAAVAFTFIGRSYQRRNINHVNINATRLEGVFSSAPAKFPHVGGIETASPFKLAAYLVCMMVGERPISTPLPKTAFGGHLADIPNHPNAVLALEMAIESLYGATVTWEDGTQKHLNNRIRLSGHSFVDIVDALSSTSLSTGFKLVAVLLEQMAYKENPDCQYSTP